MTDGLGLTGNPSSMDIGFHIELVTGSCQIEGLHDDHLAGLPSEIFLQGPFVDHELPLARLQPYPGNRCLSLSCCINGFCHFFLLIYEIYEASNFKWNGFLGFVGMFGPGIDFQFLEHLPAQTVFGQHPLYGDPDHLGGLLGQ